jgi:hypothetical protein
MSRAGSLTTHSSKRADLAFQACAQTEPLGHKADEWVFQKRLGLWVLGLGAPAPDLRRLTVVRRLLERARRRGCDAETQLENILSYPEKI